MQKVTKKPEVKVGDRISIGVDNESNAIVCQIYFDYIEIVYLGGKDIINKNVIWHQNHWEFKDQNFCCDSEQSKALDNGNCQKQKYCSQCGSVISEADKFCGGCGEEIIKSEKKIVNECDSYMGNYMNKRIFYLILVTIVWVLANALFLKNTNNMPIWSFFILAILWYSVIEFTPKK